MDPPGDVLGCWIKRRDLSWSVAAGGSFNCRVCFSSQTVRQSYLLSQKGPQEKGSRESCETVFCFKMKRSEGRLI